MLKLPSRTSGINAYEKPARLAEVLALIQVLAFGELSHRTEKGLMAELQQDKPISADQWTIIAKEHPEFFRVRVRAGEETQVSLTARHVMPKQNDKWPPLSGDHTAKLLEIAIELYDRQVRLAERWTYVIPLWVAIVGGIFTFAAVFLRYLLGLKG